MPVIDLNLARLELVTRGNWLEMTCRFHVALSGELLRVLSEIFAVIFFDSAEFIVGRPLAEVVSCFIHPEPAYSSHYAAHLSGPVEFGADALLLRIPLDICTVPNASANHENYMMALQQCEIILKQLHPGQHTCKFQVQKLMLSHPPGDRKSTRLNSSHVKISYAVFCLKKKTSKRTDTTTATTHDI